MTSSDKKENEKVFLGSAIREIAERGDGITELKENGLISAESADVLLKIVRHGDGRQDPRFQEILARELEINSSLAVENDDISRMAFISGRLENSLSMSEFDKIKRLRRFVSKLGRVIIFKGGMKTGKTDFALKLSEIYKEFEGGKVMSNMESFKAADTVKTFEELKEKAERSDNWLMIIEDASKHFSGYTADSHIIEDVFRPFKIDLGKNGGRLILLGHSGKDIHPDLRRNAALVHKTGLKTASLYENMGKNGKGRDKIMNLRDIDTTSYRYDSKERTMWEWENKDLQGEEEEIDPQEEIETKIKHLLAHQQVVKTVEVSGFSNAKIAEVMRNLSRANPDKLRFDETSSPKRLKKRVI